MCSVLSGGSISIQPTLFVHRWRSTGKPEVGNPGWEWFWQRWDRTRTRRRGRLRGWSREDAWDPSAATDNPGSTDAQRGHEKCDGKTGGGGEACCNQCKFVSWCWIMSKVVIHLAWCVASLMIDASSMLWSDRWFLCPTQGADCRRCLQCAAAASQQVRNWCPDRRC